MALEVFEHESTASKSQVAWNLRMQAWNADKLPAQYFPLEITKQVVFEEKK